MTRSRAFTLIELLASMTLATILAVTVLTVLGGISRAQSTDKLIAPTDAWSERLIDCIRNDLLNARTLRIETSGFVFDGYCKIGPNGGEAEQLPVHVRYRLTTLAGRSSLIREQRSIGSAAGVWTDLVCGDVQQFHLVKLDLKKGTSPLLVPPRVRLQLQATDASLPALDRVLVLRDPQ